MNNRIFWISLTALVLLGLLGIGGWFLFIKNKKPETIYERLASQITSGQIAQSANLDNDNDGLKNWEEALWKTDPDKSDTDKDGYSDKEETLLGFSPTDPLSNPKTGKKDANNYLAGGTGTFKETNLTEGLASVMSAQIQDPSRLEQMDFSNSLSMLDANASQTLLRFISGFNQQIATAEIKTKPDNSAAAIQKYAAEIEQAIPDNPYPNMIEDEILAEAIEEENFSKIDSYVAYYKTAIANMKKIIVPSDFLQIHKKYIELLTTDQKIYEMIKENNNDPLKIVLALQQKQKTRQEISELVIDFLNLAQEHA